MAQTVGELVVNLKANTASIATDLKKAEGMLASFGGSTAKIMANVASAAAGAGLAFAAMAAASLRATINAADRFHDLSQQFGVSVETLSGLEVGLEQSGTSVESFAVAMGKLNKATFEASQGSKEQVKAFAMLGISLTDGTGKLHGTELILRQLADRFKAMPDGATKTALAMQLLGRGAAELIPFLNEGADGLQRFLEKSKAAGRTISEETAAAADKLNDSVRDLSAAMEGLERRAGVPVIGFLAAFTRGLETATLKALALRAAASVLVPHEALASLREIAEVGLGAHAKDSAEALAKLNQPMSAHGANLSKFTVANEAAAKAAKKLHDELVEAAKKIKMVDLVPPSLLTLAEKTERAVAAMRALTAIPTELPDIGKGLRDIGAEGQAVFESTRLPVEKLATELSRLDELLSVGAINMDVYARATQQAKEQSGLLAGTMDKISGPLTELQRGMQEFGRRTGDAFRTAMLHGKGFGEVLRSLLVDLMQLLAKLAFSGVIKNLTAKGGASGVFGSLLGGLLGFAGGGPFGAGQMIMVGERGPEPVIFDRPGTVIPNGKSLGGVVVNNYIDNRGADFGTMAKTAALIAKLTQEDALGRLADRASRTA